MKVILPHAVVLIIACSLIFVTTTAYGENYNGNRQSQIFRLENCTNFQELVFDDCALCSCSMKRATIVNQIHDDCVITEDVMIHLLNLLQNAWSIITGTFSGSFGYRQASKPNAENETSCIRRYLPKSQKSHMIFDSCQDLVDDIEDLIINLTEQIRLLIGWLDDPENLNPRIAQLEECLRCVNRKLDDTIAQYDQQLGNITEQMGEMQQCFTLVILERKQEIQQLQLRLEAKSYDLIRNSVDASNYPTALAEFVRLNNETILDTLVNDIYAPNKIENLLQFIYLLPQHSQRIKMYIKLMQIMQHANHHQTILMLSFSKTFHEDMERACSNNQVSQCAEFKPTLSLVEPFMRNVKISLAKQICASDTFDIYKSASPESSLNLLGKSLCKILDDLISTSNEICPDRFTKLVEFAHDLRWNVHRQQAFTTLINIARNGKERLQIAIKMRSVLETLSGPDGEEGNVRDEFLVLKNRLPANIRNLVWHSACNLYNPDYSSEWLTIDATYGAGNSGVYTKPDNDSRAMWIFKAVERDNLEFEFLIENAQTGDYLGTHLPWKNRHDERGIAAANYPDYDELARHNYNWQIDFPDNSAIRLFHVGRQAYLFPYNDKTGQLRDVFLELSAQGSKGTKWGLTCDNF